MPDPIRFSCQLEPRFAGRRIDQVAAELLPGYSRARLQSWIRTGNLTLDGRKVRPAARVSGGEFLRLEAEPEPDGEVLAQDIPLAVIDADRHIIVLDKPAGLVVHPAAGNPDGTLQNGLLHFDPDLAAIPRAGIVHRLDKDTTGVMVVARSLEAHASLVRQLQSRSMSREYETVVAGRAPAQGRVDAPIGRHPRDRQRMAVVPSGKPAVTHYKVLQRFLNFSHLGVALETGRTHQIRVHMQHMDLPLVGDPVYGLRRRLPGLAGEVERAITEFPRQALHARTLRLNHPDSGERLAFEAPIPADLARLLAILADHDA